MEIKEDQSRYPYPANATVERHDGGAAHHAAAFPTRLALARWTRGGDIPHVFSSKYHAPLRANWYAASERNFQSWLEDGGFHQPEAVPAELARPESEEVPMRAAK